MKNLDRLKELEKIAEQLGIGQNREVKCVGCKHIIKFRNSVVLTNKKKATYLCKKCYKKLEEGELDKKQIDENALLKELDKFRKDPNVQSAPYVPSPIPWEPPKPVKWDPPYTLPYTGIDMGTAGDKTIYTICSMEDKLLKLEGFNANKENGTSR